VVVPKLTGVFNNKRCANTALGSDGWLNGVHQGKQLESSKMKFDEV